MWNEHKASKENLKEHPMYTIKDRQKPNNIYSNVKQHSLKYYLKFDIISLGQNSIENNRKINFTGSIRLY